MHRQPYRPPIGSAYVPCPLRALAERSSAAGSWLVTGHGNVSCSYGLVWQCGVTVIVSAAGMRVPGEPGRREKKFDSALNMACYTCYI